MRCTEISSLVIIGLCHPCGADYRRVFNQLDAEDDPMATCPECDSDIDVDEYDVDKGDLISCPECGTNLEVVNLAPLEFEAAPDEDDEDEDDDDDLEDDDDVDDDDDDDDDAEDEDEETGGDWDE